ncbi:hypothetical protein [Phaeacidiphilus oryzae]|uniref:hypothetical protein n=1 Tax=Phaeacidiphilus oryzae TaxID=348818 RepID=UPI000565C7C6|nr:hypothetical protein [Phaeacidiphilus oryzae]
MSEPSSDEHQDTEDAFYVLTATLLTPGQFPSVLGDDYEEACAVLGLEPWSSGYGLLFGQDRAGARWTVVSNDAALVAGAIAAWDCGLPYDLAPPDKTVVESLPGWPLPLATQSPDLPDPHDPRPEPSGRPPLTPPDPNGWGPAQRRLGADEVAREWHTWRARVSESVTFNQQDGNPGPEGAGARRSGPAGPVGRVLEEARGYLSEPPPAGRIRSAPAGGDARAIRADGPGWSLVARTDDIALVLLDEAPGQVLPIGRGSELPALLESLDRMARQSL